MFITGIIIYILGAWFLITSSSFMFTSFESIDMLTMSNTTNIRDIVIYQSGLNMMFFGLICFLLSLIGASIILYSAVRCKRQDRFERIEAELKLKVFKDD